jgi:hypothetical protein
VDAQRQLAFHIEFLRDTNANITATHACDDGHTFTALATEQSDLVTWLHSANLNVPRSACGQIQFVARMKGSGAVKAGQLRHGFTFGQTQSQ